MRPPRSRRRRARPPVLAVVASACALGGCGSSGPAATSGPPAVTASTAYPVSIFSAVSDREPSWGAPIGVEGRITGVGEGRTARLEFRRGDGAWRTVARAPIAADGTYRATVRPPGSGAIRVAVAGTPRRGRPEPVRVRVAVTVRRRRLDPGRGAPAVVAGRVRPAGPRTAVVAQSWEGERWVPVARAAAGADGGYRLTWTPKAGRWIRVTAAGRGAVGPASVLVGSTGPADTGQGFTATGPLRTAVASRFDDYGLPLACGGTLGRNEQGVAHKTLPCGTIVTIVYNGRTVQVPVIDRGPYIDGREFDLTGATANTLGFEGVHPVQVSP